VKDDIDGVIDVQRFADMVFEELKRSLQSRCATLALVPVTKLSTPHLRPGGSKPLDYGKTLQPGA
jgi:hypothetical protein